MNTIEKQVLQLLTFPENFDSICEEVGRTIPKPVIADALKNLIDAKLIVPLNPESLKPDPGAVYDTDHMAFHHYQATSKGIDLMN